MVRWHYDGARTLQPGCAAWTSCRLWSGGPWRGAWRSKSEDTRHVPYFYSFTGLPDWAIPGLDKYTRTRYFIIKAVIITGLGAFFRKGMRRGFN